MTEVDHSGLGAAYLRSHPAVPIAHVSGDRCAWCDPERRDSDRARRERADPDLAHVPLIKFEPEGAATASGFPTGGLPYLACSCGWTDLGALGWVDHLLPLEGARHPEAGETDSADMGRDTPGDEGKDRTQWKAQITGVSPPSTTTTPSPENAEARRSKGSVRPTSEPSATKPTPPASTASGAVGSATSRRSDEGRRGHFGLAAPPGARYDVPGLDEAWKAAEAALPEGWLVRGVSLDLWGLTHQPPERLWFATAGRGIEDDRPDVIESDACPTPAAALLELASRLSQPGEAE